MQWRNGTKLSNAHELGRKYSIEYEYIRHMLKIQPASVILESSRSWLKAFQMNESG